MLTFFQNLDYIQLLYAFIIGGLLCLIAQILIDKTKLTPARILVIYVTLGCILGGLGIYQYLINLAGSGASIPLTGFGYNLAKGSKEAVDEFGFIGAFIGGTRSAAGGISSAIFFGYITSLISKPKIKKQ